MYTCGICENIYLNKFNVFACKRVGGVIIGKNDKACNPKESYMNDELTKLTSLQKKKFLAVLNMDNNTLKFDQMIEEAKKV